MKANYAATGGHQAPLVPRGVRGGGGGVGQQLLGHRCRNARRSRFPDLIVKYAAEGRHVSATASSNYAPALFEKDQRSDGVKKRGFTAAMNRLFEAGRIKVEEFGPPSRRLKRIAIATAEALK
jgi:hypothetical protein